MISKNKTQDVNRYFFMHLNPAHMAFIPCNKEKEYTFAITYSYNFSVICYFSNLYN